ncbi:hypothetical protein [Leptolyngbya sp. KIOST-1]|uniref:pyroglutamyl-peptidase I family protein n=1 Tax=Leptolyngbya sp. KIOST-1 TaxID=1229172 RepID=UPI0006908A00|nr:hypothetical protein [Leptolyngbya sp. KIOST-1]
MLLTTFAPWRAHQCSNAADDLVAHLQQHHHIPLGTTVVRHIPVSFELAPIRVVAKLVELRPAVVVCCGMAEKRRHLHLERYGKNGEDWLATALPLDSLLLGTHLTSISEDAGTYVCNHLYHRLLGSIAQHRWPIHALFVHIPPLTPATQPLLAYDLTLILKRLATVTSRTHALQSLDLKSPKNSPNSRWL